MPIILNGTTGITTPGITNTGPFTFQGVVELPAGAVGAPSLTTTGDTNTGIYFPAADTIGFVEGGVEALRINSSAQIAVNTAGTAGAPVITKTDDLNTGIFFPAADTIAFAEGGVESARFDSSGRFLVKTTSNTQSVVVNAIELGGSGAADTAQPHSFIRANVGTTADYSGYLVFARSRGTTDGATTIVASGDRLGMIRFSGANGTSFSNAAEIYAAVDGTPGASNDMPGRIMFATSSDGSATPTERMRLDSSGALLIGGVGTTKSVYAFNVINDSTFNYGGNAYRIASIRSGSGDQRGVEFGYDATSGVGVIAGATQGAGTGLAFWTYDALAWGERARITAAGNFGVGTDTPTSARIVSVVSNSGTYQAAFNATNNVNADFQIRIATGLTSVGPSTSTPLIFQTSTTERARIASNGDFGIGTSSPAFKLDTWAAGEVITGTATTGSNMRGIRIYNTTTATTNNAIGLWLATGPHQAGIASFRANAGVGWDTTLAFYTHPATTSNLNDCFERMRITGEGDLLVGTTAPINSTNRGLIVHFSYANASGGGEGGIEFANTNTSTDSDVNPALSIRKGSTTTSSSQRFVQFYCSGNAMGGIVGNGATNVQFVSLSDARQKTNIQSISGSLEKILALNPVSFDWIKSGEHVKAGFVAQNVEQVFPEFVVENFDTENGEPRKGLTGGMTGGIIAHLVKAIQELKAELDALKGSN